MKIETRLSCGDTAFVLNGYESISTLTVGLVRAEVIKSKGTPWHMADNYKPQEGYKEQYMCEETGVRSGSLYTLGESIFATEAEAEAGLARAREANKEAIRRKEEWEREDKERRKRMAFRELAELGITFPSEKG